LQKENEMKSILVTSLVVILAAVIIWPVSLLSAAGPGMKGEVIVDASGPVQAFSGNVKLMSDGTITGNWEWTAFTFCGNPVKFRCAEWKDLSFPSANTATFSGRFYCNDLPMVFNTSDGVSCELRFVVTHPYQGVTALPVGFSLPASSNGDDILLVYCTRGELIAAQQGHYQVNVN
jgi:hypothetical protein